MRFASTCHKPRRLVPSTVLVAALAMGAAGARAQTSIPIAPYGPLAPDRFRSQTELVVLQVSVVDQHGRFVTGLGVDDFGVFEDGIRQNVTFFAANAAPLDLVLLIDTSSSMFGRMALAQDAAIDLIRTLKPGDRGAVVLFSHTIRIAHALTGDFAILESAIKGAVPSGATAVYEALYVTLRDLARSRGEPGEPRRQAVVVLSDGEDNRSHVEFGDLLDEAKRMTSTIFTILPGPFPDPDLGDPTRAKPNALFEMRTLAEETGGRAFAPATMADLGRIYREIASELSQQYLLAYAPQPTPVDGFRRIAVRAETHPELRVRTRSGYSAKRIAAR